MNTEVVGLLRERPGGRVTGVRYRTADGETGSLLADLVVACDGRGSSTREAAGLRARSFGVPMDVWWFRLPRLSDDPSGAVLRISGRRALVLIDRGDYWQCAYLIGKGSDVARRSEGIQALHRTLADLVPWLGERSFAIESWDEVKLLRVQLDRLRRWFVDGLLCIGDAAHAMSPVGGVGINLAVQDAVAAARILAGPLRHGPVPRAALARVQARRWLPTALTQAAQRFAHRRVVAPTLSGARTALTDGSTPPRFVRLLQRFPVLQGLPARAFAIGVLPEHPPECRALTARGS